MRDGGARNLLVSIIEADEATRMQLEQFCCSLKYRFQSFSSMEPCQAALTRRNSPRSNDQALVSSADVEDSPPNPLPDSRSVQLVLLGACFLPQVPQEWSAADIFVVLVGSAEELD
eukprot:CAMPEP_0172773784 /NCGR_PEP_ID=MMETSP1074-20121228/194916_1 /TAXON_ID=2916 /ORGANISM="Ceratium fusus, Strain PA161109" /LENGTH=115 /DNA_ID=CAMNT_0013610111 /DNA_START=38 /DNA_END=382 /DNA_ORIENTATION=+